MEEFHIGKRTYQIEKRDIVLFLVLIVVAGALIRYFIGFAAVHYFDLDYYVDWSKSAVNDGIFDIYNNLPRSRIDYPPFILYPFLLTGLGLQNPLVASSQNLIMFTVKFWQMSFDIATIVLVYFAMKRYTRAGALFAAGLWALNPTAIFNCALWGQTDSMMIFFLLAVFAAYEHDRPILAGTLMGLACTVKFQCIYFVPVLLLAILMRDGLKKLFCALGAGFLMGLLIFFPFMLRSGIELPFEVYFGGLNKWPYLTLNAFNLYGALGLNWKPDMGMLTYVGTAIQILLVAGLVFLFIYFKRPCVYLVGALFMQSIFMFTFRMHDRYQIPVLIFLLAAVIKQHSAKLFWGYVGVTGITFLNHLIVFQKIVQKQDFWGYEFYDPIMIALSIMNVALYLYVAVVSVQILVQEKRERLSTASIPQEGCVS